MKIYLQSYKKIILDDFTFFYKGDIALEKLILQSNILHSKNLFNEYLIENNINTPFSIVLVTSIDIIIISDIVRSYPVLYSIIKGEIYISENIDTIPYKIISNEAVSVFLQAGFSLGSSTIFNNIYGIQTAEILKITLETKAIERQRYFSFLTNQKAEDKELSDFVLEFDSLMQNVIGKLLKSIPEDKKIIVPLSGGHDSRIIVNYLKKLKAKNVICYSYGQVNNTQAILSEQVARSCGYEWHFIEYTEEKWAHLNDVGLIDEYIHFSFQGISIPHLQDFLAVYELKEKKIIKPGDIVVPGHTLDMLSGGHFTLSDMACTDKKSSIDRTASRHSVVPKNFLKNSYTKGLSSIYDEISVRPMLFQEYINWQERQAKFIVNSCRVYEFFDFEFYLPFWDLKLVYYFINLSQANRIQREFFKSSERKGILLPELSEIKFEDEINIKRITKSFKQKILDRVPSIIRSKISSITKKKHYSAESLNQIFALRGDTVKDIIGPRNNYPREIRGFIKVIEIRKPYRINYHLLSGILAIKLTMDKLNINNR